MHDSKVVNTEPHKLENTGTRKNVTMLYLLQRIISVSLLAINFNIRVALFQTFGHNADLVCAALLKLTEVDSFVIC